MRNHTLGVLKEQDFLRISYQKKWEDPFPDFTLEEKLSSLKLVGYAEL